jgi:two-component system, cell cycle sensor histidine kinase and response regulator CckA
MTLPFIERIANSSDGKESPELRIRVFRLICATAAVLCLVLIAPLNAFLTLPVRVDIANIALGIMGAVLYWQSRLGRNFIATFLALLTTLLDFVWFWNGGSNGSITLFFFPALIIAIALFNGWRRWALAVLLAINVCVLYLLEYFSPSLVTPFQTPMDRLLDMQTSIICSFAAVGSVAWLILTSHDRERHRVIEIADRLTTSEKNYREIFNSTSDALFIYGADGKLLDVNESACVVLGVERTTLLQSSFDTYSLGQSPYSKNEARARVGLAAAGKPQVFEWRSKRANGELFWSEVALRAWEIDGEKRVIASVRDISGRKLREQQHRNDEERLRLAMIASRQGWFELNVQSGEGVSSPEYIQIIGYEPAEFVTGFQGWITGIHAEDREAVVKSFKACAESGETSTVEYRRQTKSGGWKWIRSVGKIVEYDAVGKPLRMCGTHMDITDRKELEAQLLHSQRLEAVGTLASGVAHDLNNILTPMLMATGILRDKLLDAQDRALIGMLDESGKRGAAVVRQLLAFSRNLVQDRVPVDLRRLVEDVTQLMRSTLPKEITVEANLDDGLYLIEAEPNQLHQVLMNLCVNARDAMPNGGTIKLGLERTDLPQRAGARDGSADGGPHLALSVADTGHGIPPEIIDRIFDPFFTTKPLGKGTGLGLASVHGIVKAHHGFIRVESQPGRGTVFRAFFPVNESSVDVPPSAPATEVVKPVSAPAVTPLEDSACILVVDDDPAVLFVTSRMLEVKGYRVLQAASGAEALEKIHQHLNAVVLVITDFSMPEMDGPTLAPLLRAISPSLRIIGVSGLNQDNQAGQLAALGFCEVLRKPYEMNDLVQAVKREFRATT